MKIAIIADIHGNIQALEAVLRDIDRSDIDKVVVNGDLVNRGPNSVAVMKIVFENKFEVTLGNHDDLVKMWIDRDETVPESWFDDPFWKSTAIVADQLESAGWIDAIRKLPQTYRIKIPDAPTILISHGSPRHYREGYGTYLSDESIADIVQSYQADIFIGSHTHLPLERQWGGRLFYNTGAVGTPFNRDPRAQYLVLSLRGSRWDAEFREIEYDRDGALADFENTGYVKNGDLSAHIFREELYYACAMFDPFWRWVQAEKLSTNWDCWHVYREKFKERFRVPNL